MGDLPVRKKNLAERIEEAVEDVDSLTYEGPDGKGISFKRETKQYVIRKRICDEIADYLQKNLIDLPEVEETTLSMGSGDTGGQTKLSLRIKDDVPKDVARVSARQIDTFLDAVFPSDFLVGISNYITMEDDDIRETDEFHIFVVYNVRSAKSPRKPIGESTEVV